MSPGCMATTGASPGHVNCVIRWCAVRAFLNRSSFRGGFSNEVVSEGPYTYATHLRAKINAVAAVPWTPPVSELRRVTDRLELACPSRRRHAVLGR